jgi:hypothetical protein
MQPAANTHHDCTVAFTPLPDNRTRRDTSWSRRMRSEVVMHLRAHQRKRLAAAAPRDSPAYPAVAQRTVSLSTL